MASATIDTDPLADPLTEAEAEAGRARKDRRARNAHRRNVILIQIAVIAGFLGLWELAAGRLIDDLLISRPSEIFPTFWTWVTNGDLFYHASSTLKDAVMGLLAGGLAGLIVGAVLGQSERLAEIFEPFITALYTLPKHALIPLFIMWVGIGTELRVLTAAVIVFFLVFFNTFFGIKDVSRALINSVRVMGGSNLDVMARVRLPSALIWVVAALKLAVPQAIVGVVVAEMLAGDRGLGYLVARNAGLFNSKGTFAAIFALLIIGFVIDRLMTLVTKRPLQWKNSKSAM
ncbi:ABC transporter permease [Blastococcus sp. SYSU DS0533]